jgi:hypothetical protein
MEACQRERAGCRGRVRDAQAAARKARRGLEFRTRIAKLQRHARTRRNAHGIVQIHVVGGHRTRDKRAGSFVGCGCTFKCDALRVSRAQSSHIGPGAPRGPAPSTSARLSYPRMSTPQRPTHAVRASRVTPSRPVCVRRLWLFSVSS